MSNQPDLSYHFGPFCLDPKHPRLTRDGEIVALTPKALEILSLLVESRGIAVEKEDLMRRVWPDTFVEEGNLSVHIYALRKALGETPDGESYIETVPRLGYRFLGSIQEVKVDGADLLVERHTLSHVVVEESSPGVTAEPLALPEKARSTLFSYRRRTVLLAVVLAVGLIGLIGYLWLSQKAKPPATTAEVKSIAILPFTTLNKEVDDEYLGVGLADALITQFGQTTQIIVRPTTTVLKYAEKEQDPLAAGKLLKVDAVLEGSVHRVGERLRVTVRLIRVSDGLSLWTAKFDENFKDIFAVEDSISAQVVQALRVDDTDRLKKRYPQNAEAYQAYLRGRFFWSKRTDEGNQKAIDYFRQAINKDSLYAVAYAGLAEAYTLSSYYSSVLPREAFPKAKAAAERALEIDGTLAEAWSTLAYVKFIYDWDFEGSDRDFRRTFELNPNYATARFWHGECLIYRGRFEEGIEEIDRAHQLDPLSAVFSAHLGWAYHIARQHDRAIKQLQETLEMDPDFAMTYFYLGMAYEEKRMFEESIAAYKKSIELSGEFPGTTGLAHVYAISGRRGEAQQILEKLEQQARDGKPIRPTTFAIIYAALNDREKALESLEKGYGERYEVLLYLKVQPYFDNLRSEPRFVDLLQRIGLSP
jgi:DNA-binding winged helix-turn-helix (wHTH) protein/TolB-like protein/Flp pilus assembly protein TadD